MIKIGNTALRHGLMLAPMAGVTDLAMRKICADRGAEYAVSEMVSAKALVYEQGARAGAPTKTAALCKIDGEIPTAIQIFGSDSEFMAEAARLLSSGEYRGFCGILPAAVDINMGCPVKKVVSCGEGSALMRTPEKIYDIVSAVCRASALPVTVKLRAGWDLNSLNAPECAAAAESAGAAAVCVHARTREQFYTPGIMPEIIRLVKERVRIPVFGNGDISCAADALKMKSETGCDGFAVGRAAMGNPWIFNEISAALDGTEYVPPSAEEIAATAVEQLRRSVAEKGERQGVAEVKVTLSHYVKGLHGATRARAEIMAQSSAAAIEEALLRVLLP
ncbi:MAG: tRNA-dihydrouridine synthase [Clostridia bacterium]|nr:tRNA-dihydrouridine synthase [Clostridia bacterium]